MTHRGASPYHLEPTIGTYDMAFVVLGGTWLLPARHK